MELIGLGKRQGFANETGQALPQGVEPTLTMMGLPTVLADRLMTVGRKNALICLPEITERVATCVGWWDAPPEWITRLNPLDD